MPSIEIESQDIGPDQDAKCQDAIMPKVDDWAAAVERFHVIIEYQLAKLRASLLEHQQVGQADSIEEEQLGSVCSPTYKRDVSTPMSQDAIEDNDSLDADRESSSRRSCERASTFMRSIPQKWLHLASQAMESFYSPYGAFAEHFVWLKVDEKWYSEVEFGGEESLGVTRYSSSFQGSPMSYSKSYREASSRLILRHKRRLFGMELQAYNNVLRKSLSSMHHGSCGWGVVAHPYSCRRFLWIWLSLLCILYDFVMVSMTPFKVFTPAVQRASDWCIAIFWTLDIAMSFTTGYYRQGRLQMRWRAVALYYATRWFPVDFVIVTFSWLPVLLASSSMGARASRSAARAVVLFRVGRLARMTSLRGLLRSIRSHDFLRSSPMRLTLVHHFKSTGFVIGLFLFVHFCGCMWYWLGDGLQNGWVSRSQHVKHAGTHAAALYNYLLSLTWAMSTLQGNVELDENKKGLEMLFELLVSFISIIVLAAFVSSLTNTMAEIIKARNRASTEKRSLWAYLLKHDINNELAEKVQSWLLMKVRGQIKEEDEADRRALEALPKQLGRQLKAEARSKHLIWHPIFPYVEHTNKRLQVHICCDAIRQEMFEEHEEVFFLGEACVAAYFVVSGKFRLGGILSAAAEDVGRELVDVLVGPEIDHEAGVSSPADVVRRISHASTFSIEVMEADYGIEKRARLVNEASVVSEAALWMRCRHGGSLVSCDHSMLYIVSSDGPHGFLELVQRDSSVHGTLSWYAQRFTRCAKDAMRGDPDWVLDLFDHRSVLERERHAGIVHRGTEHSFEAVLRVS